MHKHLKMEIRVPFNAQGGLGQNQVPRRGHRQKLRQSLQKPQKAGFPPFHRRAIKLLRKAAQV